MIDPVQIIADFVHLIAILLLILKIISSKSTSGISLKTQILFASVFCLRYLDIFFQFKSFYMFIMKITFVGTTFLTIYLIKFKRPYCLSYDENSDRFPFIVLYAISLVLCIFIHKAWYWQDLLWSYSIWIESMSIIPQLLMIRKLKDVQNLTVYYVLMMGAYRMIYIIHWFLHWQKVYMTSFFGGLIQSILYGDFIYYYAISKRQNQKIIFPI